MQWWLVALAGLVAGLGGGFLLGRAGNSAVRRSKELDQELQEARDELTRYRSRVAEHFSSTAELVNTMTENYRAVYAHLANGAQQLCGDQDLRLQAIRQSKSLPGGESPDASQDEEAAGSPGESAGQGRTGDGEQKPAQGKRASAGGESSADVTEPGEGWYQEVEREDRASDYVKEERQAEKDRVH